LHSHAQKNPKSNLQAQAQRLISDCHIDKHLALLEKSFAHSGQRCCNKFRIQAGACNRNNLLRPYRIYISKRDCKVEGESDVYRKSICFFREHEVLELRELSRAAQLSVFSRKGNFIIASTILPYHFR
jgi:hypothetical protein